MNDKSISQELINYRRYVLKTMWGGAMRGSPRHAGISRSTAISRRVSCKTLAKWARWPSTASEKEAETLLADLQSNGDIQISGPEESILKTRRKSARRAIAINLAESPRFNLSDLVAMQGFIALYLIACLDADQSQHPTRFWL